MLEAIWKLEIALSLLVQMMVQKAGFLPVRALLIYMLHSIIVFLSTHYG